MDDRSLLAVSIGKCLLGHEVLDALDGRGVQRRTFSSREGHVGTIRKLPPQGVDEFDVGLERLLEDAELLGGVPYPLVVVGACFEEDASDGGIESNLFLGLGSGGTVG